MGHDLPEFEVYNTEKAVFSQTHSHMMAHSYPELQSSYRRYHSTETALLKVTNNILLKMNSQEVILLVTLDLSSAFDTVNHEILLRRLQMSLAFTEKSWIGSNHTCTTEVSKSLSKVYYPNVSIWIREFPKGRAWVPFFLLYTHLSCLK